ncbi:MAG: hypothetical protein R2710_20270 [Acidimicrobiales bacterium]
MVRRRARTSRSRRTWPCRFAPAEQLGCEPIVSHASMALQNWRRVHVDEPLSADNAELLVGFHGGTDETWFFTATLGVELAAAPIIADLHAAANAAANHDHGELLGRLVSTANAMLTPNVALERMREWCDPHFFYGRLRPFLAGWPEPGVVYEGVDPTPRILAGGSAGQSSVIQASDAAPGSRIRAWLEPSSGRCAATCHRHTAGSSSTSNSDRPCEQSPPAVTPRTSRRRTTRSSASSTRSASATSGCRSTTSASPRTTQIWSAPEGRTSSSCQRRRTDTLGARPFPSGPS